jgi:CRISPR-associated Csx2 family protein
MARKVFISFLGSSFYGNCQYSSGDFISTETRFIQQATLEWIEAKKWSDNDTALILLTSGEKGSRAINWDKSIVERENFKTEKKEKESYLGLEKVLENMNLPFKTQPIDVPDGKDEKEIWEIFQVIFSHLQEKDELYFDLTHGFRYLPMLLLVLGNYAKFLKDITIAHISYGNYEGRDHKTNLAPFVNLLPLSKLQDWSSAAKDFINYGKTEDLKTLLDADNNPILKDTQGKDETAKTINGISKGLQNFSSTILANKLDEIIQGVELDDKIEILKKTNEIISKPFIPLLEKIGDKLKPFQKDDLGNVFAATDWCIRHELYQNAYSILLEGIISIVLNKIGEDYKGNTPFVEAKRGILNYVSECFIKKNKDGILEYTKETCIDKFRISEKLQSEAESLKVIVGKIWDLMDKDFAKSIATLNSKRNAFMHAGTGTNQLQGLNDLKSNIEKYNNKLHDWYKSKQNNIMLINLSNHPSHSWKEEQLEAASSYGEVVNIPFPDVDPKRDEAYIQTLSHEYMEKISQLSQENNVTVHVMGEMTLTHCLVNALLSKRIPCIASTTQRIVTEKEDGTKEVQFVFSQFREYR